jgi:hypothetical protein
VKDEKIGKNEYCRRVLLSFQSTKQESGKDGFSVKVLKLKAKEEMEEEQSVNQAATRSGNKKKIQQDSGRSSKLWKAMAATSGLTIPTKEITNSKETFLIASVLS